MAEEINEIVVDKKDGKVKGFIDKVKQNAPTIVRDVLIGAAAAVLVVFAAPKAKNLLAETVESHEDEETTPFDED